MMTPSAMLSTASSKKPFQLGYSHRAQLQGVLDAAKAVKNDEQAEHDGQDAHHDVAADDEERAQPQTHKAGDQGQLALEHPALHRKIADELHGRTGQHHAAQRVADDVERCAGDQQQEDAQPQIQDAHQHEVPF